MWWEEFERLEKEFEKIRKRMEEIARAEFRPLKAREFPIDIKEREDELIIEAEIPGIKKENIEINLTENSLSIKAEKKEKKEEKEEGYLHRERSYFGFHRVISLPVAVIPEKAKASYQDGILRIVVPKKEKKEVKGVKVKIE
jgi:HSP20 family protein